MQQLIVNNNKGVTLLYVIMALLAVSFIGIGLTNAAKADVQASIYAGVSESAREATLSGYTAAVAFIETDDEDIQLSLMKKLNYLNNVYSDEELNIDPDSLWLQGDKNTFLTIGNSKMSYRSQIESYDRQNSMITLRVDASAHGKSRASGRGVYYLDNLEWQDSVISSPNPLSVPSNALHLGGGTGEIDRGVIINGDFYAKGKVNFTPSTAGGGDYSILNGTLRVETVVGKSCLLKNLHVTGPAYFTGDGVAELADFPGTSPYPTAFSFASIGVDENCRVTLNSDADITYNDDAQLYFNGTTEYMYYDIATTPSVQWHMDNGTINYWSGATFDGGMSSTANAFFHPASSGNTFTSNGTKFDIPAALGISTEQPNFGVHMDDIRAVGMDYYTVDDYQEDFGYSMNSTRVFMPDGNKMNSLWEWMKENRPDNFYEDEWLVLNWKGGSDAFTTPAAGGTGEFKYKVIWLFDEASFTCNSKFYKSSTEGNTFMYIGPGRLINGLGGFEYFRGFIYIESSLQTTLKAMGDETFNGAIYFADESGGSLRVEGPASGAAGKLNINFNGDVLADLADIGVFYEIGGEETITETVKVLRRTGDVTANLLSRSF